MSTVYTPRTLAEKWAVSERHVRNLIEHKDPRLRLQAFRVGGKLLRISQAEVERYEQCQIILSDGSEADLCSSTGETESGNVTRLGPIARAELRNLRQRYTND